MRCHAFGTTAQGTIITWEYLFSSHTYVVILGSFPPLVAVFLLSQDDLVLVTAALQLSCAWLPVQVKLLSMLLVLLSCYRCFSAVATAALLLPLLLCCCHCCRHCCSAVVTAVVTIPTIARLLQLLLAVAMLIGLLTDYCLAVVPPPAEILWSEWCCCICAWITSSSCFGFVFVLLSCFTSCSQLLALCWISCLAFPVNALVGVSAPITNIQPPTLLLPANGGACTPTPLSSDTPPSLDFAKFKREQSPCHLLDRLLPLPCPQHRQNTKVARNVHLDPVMRRNC